MTDWQRLEQVIKWTGLSTNAFAVGIGLKRSENLYQIKRGNNGISKDLAELIARKYPNVNRAWLLTGDGEMFGETSASGGSAAAGQPEGIPYYNTDAIRFVCETGRRLPAYYINVPGFGDCDFAAVVTGDGMAPEVPAGAIVALKQVDPAGPVLPGEIYLAVTQQFALMRYVKLDRKVPDGLWLNPPDGSDEEPVGIRRERLTGLYLVKGIVIHKVL